MSILDIFRISKIKSENEQLANELLNLQSKLDKLGVNEYYQTKEKIDREKNEFDNYMTQKKSEMDSLISDNENKLSELTNKIQTANNNFDSASQNLNKLNKSILTQEKKLSRIKELYSSMTYAMDNFFNADISLEQLKIPEKDFDEAELFSPSIFLKLHAMDVKSLKKAYIENNKQITKILEQYSAKYTTKANKAIYQLMVIALRAELQNILYNLKYDKLDKAIDDVKNVTQKYLNIANTGNQSIAGTLTKFIGEIEYLFISAVKIEYNYYVKKEQAKQEQLALKQQMREEAEERKLLEQEKKKIAKEEEKYNNEILKNKQLLEETTDESKIKDLQAKILELQSKLSDVVVKKDEVAKLQNGKAGNVYIISNIGSFGEDIFKVGMTRRMDPQERIDELGNASVPFKFDVHSFIFSDDAVTLENQLHNILNDKRVNKVNLRKEFFKIGIDELEQIVTDIDPAAEFNKTILAEEFRQSLSSDELYTSKYISNDDSEEDDD